MPILHIIFSVYNEVQRLPRHIVDDVHLYSLEDFVQVEMFLEWNTLALHQQQTATTLTTTKQNKLQMMHSY